MIVYRHRRLDTNEVFYVGIGTSKYRATEKVRRSEFWKRIVNKTDYSVEIIAEVDTWELACELECFLIEEYGRRDLGIGTLVNMTDGGDGVLGLKHTEEAKKKISEVHKGKKLSQEHKDNISKAKKGIVTFPNRTKTSRGYKVLNTETNEIYPSILSTSKAINMNCETLRGQLLGKYRNKTNLVLYDEEDSK